MEIMEVKRCKLKKLKEISNSPNDKEIEQLINFILYLKRNEFQNKNFGFKLFGKSCNKNLLDSIYTCFEKLRCMPKFPNNDSGLIVIEFICELLKLFLNFLDSSYNAVRLSESGLRALFSITKINKIKGDYKEEYIKVIQKYYKCYSGKLKIFASLIIFKLNCLWDENLRDEIIDYYENLTKGSQKVIFSVNKNYLVETIKHLYNMDFIQNSRVTIELCDILDINKKYKVEVQSNTPIKFLQKYFDQSNKFSRIYYIYNYKSINPNNLLIDYDIVQSTKEYKIYYCVVQSIPKYDDKIETSNGLLSTMSTISSSCFENKDEKIFLREYTITENCDLKAIQCDLLSYCTLLKHENVVQLRGLFETYRPNQHLLCIGLEYMEYGSIRSYIDREGEGFNSRKTLNVMIQVLNALKFMHSKGMLHRNIRCHSIFLVDNPDYLDDDVRIKLSNFSVSKHIMGYNSKNMLDGFKLSQTLVHHHFLAPEVIKDKIYGLPADIWSIGATIVEMMTGYLPFQTESIKDAITFIRENDFSRLTRSFTNSNMLSVVMDCFQDNPKDRPDSDSLYSRLVKMNNYKMISLYK